MVLLRKLAWAASLVVVSACGGPRGGGGTDAAVDGAHDAGLHDGAPDGGGMRDGGGTPDGSIDADVRPDLGTAPCTNSGDCDDMVFCNGAEDCQPTSPMRDVRGCVPGTSPCLAGQTCDEAGARCVTSCAGAMDADGDGHVTVDCGGDDCDDMRAEIHPGAPELCDGYDDDCNGLFDGPGEDVDADGHTSRLCAGVRGDDCDDHDPTTYVGAPELCDGVDNDCSRGGGVEPADDMDGDGYAPIAGACSGGPLPKTDCDDTLGFVHPGAVETCNGLDDDCAGGVDDGTDPMCAMPHSTAACVMGSCRITACASGFDDCDVSVPGCEAELAVDPLHCGACGTACFDGATCASSRCSPIYAWDVEGRGGGTDQVVDLAVDHGGNVVAAVSAGTGIDLGGGPLTLPSFGGAVIASWTSTGAPRFARTPTTDGMQAFARAVAVDASGNSYLVGNTQGSLTFAGTTYPSSGAQDAFVASWDATGHERWARLFGGPMQDDANDVAVDASGNVYVVGLVRGSVDFGGGTRAAVGGVDAFVVSFDASGVHRWSSIYGSTSDDFGYTVAVGTSGIVVGAGETGAASFGGGTLPFGGAVDVVLARYTLSGAHLWSHAWGAATSEYVSATVVMPDDSIVIAGSTFAGGIDFGSGPLVASAVGYVARFDSLGTSTWSQPIVATASTDEALTPTVAGGVLVSASTSGFATIAGGRTVSRQSQVARLSSAGSSDLALGFGSSTGTFQTLALAGTSPGRVYVGGTLRSTVDFGGGARTSDSAGDAAIVAIDF